MANVVFTWNDLLSAIQNLTPEQREKPVCFRYEDHSDFKAVHSLAEVEEDVYAHKDGDTDDASTIEELKELHGDDYNEDDYKLCTPKGTPYLWDGF